VKLTSRDLHRFPSEELLRLLVQKLEKALVAELQGLQRIHVAIANQLTRLKACRPSSVRYVHTSGPIESSKPETYEQDMQARSNLMSAQQYVFL
jgi:hypothetical protein